MTVSRTEFPDIRVIRRGKRLRPPHAETLELISGSGAKCCRTDLNGTIIVYSDGTEIFVRTEKGDNNADN